MQDFQTYQAIPDYLTKSYAANLLRYAPNGMCPLFGLTNVLGTGVAVSVEHGYFAKTMIFPAVVLSAAVVDGVATTFTVVSTANILPGDILRAQSTGEVVRVATVASATSITVLRGVGQIAAGAIATSISLYGIGNSHEQGSLRPASRVMNPVRVLNHTHIFRNAWSTPDTMTAIAPIVGGSIVAEDRIDCGLLHGADIEKALIFSQKSGQVINGQYHTTMDGLVETVRRLAPAANTSVAGATTTYDQLETMLDPCFDTITDGRNGNERTIFVGGTARKVINNIGRLSGQYQIVDGQTNFGLQFQTFKTSRGMFRMIEHPMLNSNSAWSQMAIAADLPSIRVCYLRKTMNDEYNMSGQKVDNGIDAVGGCLTSELTAEIVNPSAHAIITGLTAGAA